MRAKKPTPTLHVYLIDDGEQYWYVAKSPRSAMNMFLKANTYPKMTPAQYRTEYPDTTIIECDENKDFTITDRGSDTGTGQDEHRTMTSAEWIKECGEGCLATSNF